MAEREHPLALSSADAERAREVARLADAGAASVPALVAALDEPSWAVRRAVVAALARIGEPALPALCGVLVGRRDSETRLAAAVDALVAARGDVERAMVALSTQPEATPPVLCDVAQVLGRRESRAETPLLERLVEHPDDNVAVAAIEALGRIGGAAGLDTVIRVMQRRSFFRTFPAIAVLGASDDRRAVEPLVELTAEPLFALEAVRALGRLGDPAALGPLVRLLGAPDDSLVRAAGVALAAVHAAARERSGDEARLEARVAAARANGVAVLERLGAAISSSSEPAEVAALAEVIGWTGGPEAARLLVAIVDRGDVAAVAAVAALRRIGAAADVAVAEGLRTGDAARRLRLLPTVTALPAALREALSCLRDSDPAVRAAACEAIARAGDPAAVDALFPLLDDPDAGVSQAASGAIQSLGSARTEELALAALRSPSERVRRAALRIVACFGYPAALDLLLEAVAGAPPLRDAAIAGLAAIDDPRARVALLAALAHPAAKTRAAAARALGHTSAAPAVVTALVARLRDDDPWVRYYACQAIGRLPAASAAGAVFALLDDPAGQVRVAAVETMARVGTPEALDALHDAAAADDPDVRRAALLGLGILRRRESFGVIAAALDSPDLATRLVAVSACAELDGPEVAEALARAARGRAARRVHDAGREPSPGGVHQSDLDRSVATAALGALARRRGPEATRALIDLAADVADAAPVVAALAEPSEGRIEAIELALCGATGGLARRLAAALARAGTPEALGALVAVLGSATVDGRRAAAEALAGFAEPEARAALARAAATDPDPEVRRISSMRGLG